MYSYIIYLAMAVIAILIIGSSYDLKKIMKADRKQVVIILIILFFLGSALVPLFT